MELKAECGTLQVQWEKDRVYEFEYRAKGEGCNKFVYKGEFIGNAPEGVQPDTPCCLKKVIVSNSAFPQFRELFELVDFKGAHLRRILARNPNALEAAAEIRLTGSCREMCNCYVVEPIYEETRELFEDCYRYSVDQRLDVVEQYALGSQELSSDENMVGNRHVIAHRDLKGENGVREAGTEELHIRLIDYASVALERDRMPCCEEREDGTPPTMVREVPSGTMEMPMSPGNTAPEMLRQERFPLTETVDVYALGMMLASLFVTAEGSYENPNGLWCTALGWRRLSRECVEASLRQRFGRCEECYEARASWNNTWIEQDLRELNVELVWETLTDDGVQQQIRELFFRATRIDPRQRIGRSEFIQTLKRIREHVNRSKSTLPVSLYLVEQQEMKITNAAYMTAAVRAFEMEREDARIRGERAPAALCVSYREALRSQDNPKDCAKLVTRYPCADAKELAKCIAVVEQVNGPGESQLACALYMAYTYLMEHREQFSFTGCIHLLVPEIPCQEQIAKLYGQYDIFGLCGPEGLGQLCGCPVQICAHTLTEPTRQVLEESWCSYELIRVPVPKVRPQVKPEVVQPKGIQPDSGFLTGAGASFFLTEDGRKIYIGRK